MPFNELASIIITDLFTIMTPGNYLASHKHEFDVLDMETIESFNMTNITATA